LRAHAGRRPSRELLHAGRESFPPGATLLAVPFHI